MLLIVKQILLVSISEIVERVVRRIYTLMLGCKRLGIPHLIGFYLILSAWVKPRRKLDYYDDEDEEEELLDWVCIFNWFLFSFIRLIPNLSAKYDACSDKSNQAVFAWTCLTKIHQNHQFWLKFAKIFKSMNIHLVWWNFVKSAIFFTACISGHVLNTTHYLLVWLGEKKRKKTTEEK